VRGSGDAVNKPGRRIQNVTANEFARIFAMEAARFGAVNPRAFYTRLEWTEGQCSLPDACAVRDIAYSVPSENRIVINSRLLDRPRENWIGILRHELAHVIDTMPYVPNGGGEQRADDIAERVGGQRIYYDQDFVQTISPTNTYPRPSHLHS